MKFLYKHPRVQQLLLGWANEEPLVTSNFFFCHQGRPQQKTHEGLSRELLYSILSQDSALIPCLLPEICRDTRKADGPFINIPSLAEIKVCFFIAGLDEYFGSPIGVVQFIIDLASKLQYQGARFETSDSDV
ncbi:hypothetical protein PG988_000524 [Apiospora saccharicola]